MAPIPDIPNVAGPLRKLGNSTHFTSPNFGGGRRKWALVS